LAKIIYLKRTLIETGLDVAESEGADGRAGDRVVGRGENTVNDAVGGAISGGKHRSGNYIKFKYNLQNIFKYASLKLFLGI